jgi:uncharacterized protein (TIGR03118 family)
MSVPVDASSVGYNQTNLVTDDQTVLASRGFSPAAHTDPNLVNPWGIALTPTASPFWVADNVTGKSTLYNGSGNPQSLVVTMPSAFAPTGVVFHSTAGFNVSANPALFIFAAEDGSIAGWNGASGTSAVTAVGASTLSVFKGLAIGNDAGNDRLYATDFRARKVRVFDTNFSEVITATSFIDPDIPTGFAPFGIQNLGGLIYVTYAKQDVNKFDDVAGAGNGYVDVYDTAGVLVKRLASQGSLNSPWGLAMAPATFGDLANTLLVGNFGDGRINAVDPVAGGIVGQVNDSGGQGIVIEGLWGLTFGNGGNGGDPSKLYFAAGINGEQDGLFGVLAANSPAVIASPSPGNGSGANPSGSTPGLPNAGSPSATRSPGGPWGWLLVVALLGAAPVCYRRRFWDS